MNVVQHSVQGLSTLLLELDRVLDGIFVFQPSVAIHCSRAELCSGDAGFAQAEMPGFMHAIRTLDRPQLSGKKYRFLPASS